MGAHHFISTGDRKVFTEYANHFDLIVNTVFAGIDMGDYFGLLGWTALSWSLASQMRT